ncbi:MAG TPA: hypothetical protein VG937_07555 [Polyangiaceae bacterium]|nr:hypothetical protein [Polyangiaceae bacterium]
MNSNGPSVTGQTRVGANVRSALVLVSLLVATVGLSQIFGRTFALENWLIWRYLRAWAAVLAFSLAALSVGNFIVGFLSAPGERQDAHITFCFATGTYAFFLAVFLVGILGLLGRLSFFAIPCGLFALGAPRLSRDLLAYRARQRERPSDFRLSLGEAAASALGLVGLVAIFLPTLVPENVAYDARWYHLPLAEHYVAAGAIRPMGEGALAGTVPHLASLLYTWAFSAPGDLFDHVELAAQLEVGIFLFTLGGIPALVRLLVPASRGRASWATFFLFPAILIYDSTLLTAADHVAALWTIPTWIAFVRAVRDLKPRACLLLTIQLCGLMMTKYTSAMAVVFPVLGIALRSAVLAFERVRGRTSSNAWFSGPLVATGAGLALTAPHWLKNWLWYGDPVYPLLRHHLHVRPWIPDGERLYQIFSNETFHARGTWPEKLRGALHGLYDYSYGLYTWQIFHDLFPVFGSLFTCCLFALPFLKGTRRVWLLAAAVHLGLFTWYLFFSEDRYLQALLPWMVGATSAIFSLAWSAGLAARAGVVALAGLQLVWGAETVFWPTHQMHGRSGISLVNDFFARTMRKDTESRTKPFEELARIGRSIEKSSKVLVHAEHLRLGIGVQTATDAYRVQYGISYGYLDSAGDVYHLFRKLGITHVLWAPEQTNEENSLAAELVFHGFVSRYLHNVQNFGSRSLGELPQKAPPTERSEVLYYGCDGKYENGLYELSDLRVSPLLAPGEKLKAPPLPRVRIDDKNRDTLVRRANYVVVSRQCGEALALQDFERIARWRSAELMLRKP